MNTIQQYDLAKLHQEEIRTAIMRDRALAREAMQARPAQQDTSLRRLRTLTRSLLYGLLPTKIARLVAPAETTCHHPCQAA